MRTACWLLLVTGSYPLWRAWQANRQTSLLHAVFWATLAWASWTAVAISAEYTSASGLAAGRYLALCLTGSACIAVLGARRPGVSAWNFVVAALTAVNLLPLGEGLILGKSLNLDWLRAVCVAATITVGIVNYLPTRLATAALALLLGSVLQAVALVVPTDGSEPMTLASQAGWLALALVPWLAFAALRRARPGVGEFDTLWLDYRDRFGLVWAQRLREQFNRSGAHSGWPVMLRWKGLRLLPGAAALDANAEKAMVGTLRALLKRFGAKEDKPECTLSQ